MEEMCMTHLARRSRIPLKEQFQLSEMHHSERLMIQVCSSIEDAYELDEVVPKNLDSFCNTTKNIVLQRSFELLGIRKPLLPPQSEEPSHVFEKMMNEFLDQADIQNHHGMILADQAALLENHILFEEYLDRVAPEAKILIQQDPRMHELMEQLQNTHSAAERNAVRAQILVVKLKNIYTKQCEKGVSQDRYNGTPDFLEKLYRIMLRNQRDHSKSVPSVRGEKLIDHIYRRIMETVDAKSNYETVSLYDGTEPTWVSKIKQTIEALLPCRDEITADDSYRISRVTRGVSDGTRFQVLTQFVQIARESYFMGRMRSEEDNWNQK
ncbi:hypothetical protein CAEBREN_24645 [Caenorhabditis brenneri]|uniref:Uncharacterized protein n=1 Tax=Caenorhabditis brenneri TaxID=135651 RepID=G0ND37_CAEBE|nr:hypothetical protein CAEBREN_24645 [Caenorhabditis brenneri]